MEELQKHSLRLLRVVLACLPCEHRDSQSIVEQTPQIRRYLLFVNFLRVKLS